MGGMSGRPCVVCVPLFYLLVALVGQSWSPVAPGCFPVRLRFLRECFLATSEADRGADPVNEETLAVVVFWQYHL